MDLLTTDRLLFKFNKVVKINANICTSNKFIIKTYYATDLSNNIDYFFLKKD
jgi:hypothetical protein